MKPSFIFSGFRSRLPFLLLSFLVLFVLAASAHMKTVTGGKKSIHHPGSLFTLKQQPQDSTPTYPGGPMAWLRYLNRNFHYPDAAVQQGIEGIVIVQFRVDSTGTTSDIHAISGPATGGLLEHSEWIIQKSGKWVPAYKDGVPTTATKKQPIIFRLL